MQRNDQRESGIILMAATLFPRSGGEFQQDVPGPRFHLIQDIGLNGWTNRSRFGLRRIIRCGRSSDTASWRHEEADTQTPANKDSSSVSSLFSRYRLQDRQSLPALVPGLKPRNPEDSRLPSSECTADPVQG